MSLFDIGLLVLLAGFVLNGLTKGLIRILGNVVGLIIGAFVASRYYLLLYEWGKDWTQGHENTGKVIAFIILFIAVTKVTVLLFFLVEKFFNFIAVIPGSRYINNILGGLLGFLEGSLFLGLILFVASRYAFLNSYFASALAGSKVAPLLLYIVNLILPILPGALKALKSII